MLARRYLNPRRAVLSSFTLISLIGVMLGVVVLVVVMAVYAGLERDVKARLLGFTPHILLRHAPAGFAETPIDDWRETLTMAAKLPGVSSATPFITDNVIIDVESWQRPVMFRGIDSSDPTQVEGIRKMLDLVSHPKSTADMGLDDRAVVSSILAAQLSLQVGDTIRLYSTRNFEQVMQAYKATEKPPLRLAYPDLWKSVTDGWSGAWQPRENGGAANLTGIVMMFEALQEIASKTLRSPEMEQVQNIMDVLRAAEPNDDRSLYLFPADAKTTIDSAIAELNQSDPEKMDADTLKRLKHLVLPKEAVICGIYQASQLAVTPDLFVPLPLAQDLAGLDDSVQGIALRLEDAYAAERVAHANRTTLGPEWNLLTWGDQYQTFFALINQQRVMMYFALSFIVLVSAFSMMAVMFTVTIQKRREIGVMKALGAAPGQIVRVFLYQGMILGLLGSVLGVALGRLIIHYRGHVQSVMRALDFDPFSATFTGFDTLPAHNNPLEQGIIALMAFILCSLAALVPAFFAARCDAAKSLRNL